jgi:hypothetical protein
MKQNPQAKKSEPHSSGFLASAALKVLQQG